MWSKTLFGMFLRLVARGIIGRHLTSPILCKLVLSRNEVSSSTSEEISRFSACIPVLGKVSPLDLIEKIVSNSIANQDFILSHFSTLKHSYRQRCLPTVFVSNECSHRPIGLTCFSPTNRSHLLLPTRIIWTSLMRIVIAGRIYANR